MRLPFGLGRRSSSGDGASGDGSGTSGAAFDGAPVAADASGAADGGSSPAPRAWASLPAIQRTAGDMPLVAAPGRFVQRLPGSAGLPPIVQPLGHEVSPLATPGLVVARVRAVEAASTSAIPPPVQRRAARGADDAAVEAPAFETEAFATTATVASAAPAPAVPPPVHVESPVRTMPTVSRQAIRLPERPLTSAAVAARPASVQRATPMAAPSPDAPALPRPSGGMRRVPSAATPTPVAPVAPVAPVVSREAASPHATTTSAATAPQPAAALSGPTRRGLGEPMQAAPTSARPVASVLAGPVVSRSTTSGPMPIAASNLRPVAQRSAEGGPGPLPGLGTGRPGAAADASRAGALPELRLPHLPVQRSADTAGPAPVAASAVPTPAPIASGPEIRPIAGANPIRPSIEIQRAASDDHDEPPDDELPSPWWNPASSPDSEPAHSNATMAGLGGAASVQVPASVQRSAAATGAAPTMAAIPWRGADRDRPAAAARSAPVASPVQRIAGPALRPGALPQPVGAGSRHGASAGTSGLDSAAAATAPAPARVFGGGPVVQTSPAGAIAPTTQAPAASSFGGPAVVQREEAGVPAAPAPGGSSVPSERDLDELAQALFGRIRGRLRSDLMYDREAKGLTFDNV